MRKVLIIAAHPDDEILGCGGLLSKYREKLSAIKILFIGEGSSCRYLHPSELDALEAVQTRTRCAIGALKILGINNIEFSNLPCGRLDQIPILEINKIIERALEDFGPDTVFTHSADDANSDHRVVYSSTIMATRPIAASPVERLLSYEVLSSTEWSFASAFEPNYFEELDSTNIEMKWAALSKYESEIKSFPFPRSQQGIEALAMMRGMQSGVKYAEAFRIIREFKRL